MLLLLPLPELLVDSSSGIRGTDPCVASKDSDEVCVEIITFGLLRRAAGVVSLAVGASLAPLVLCGIATAVASGLLLFLPSVGSSTLC